MGALLQKQFLIFACFLFCSAEASCFLSLEDAIKATLQNQWSIQLSEQQTDVQIGLLRQAAGAFDVMLSSNFSRLYQVDLQSPSGAKSDFLGSITQTNLQLQKLTRLGTLYTLSYSNTNVVNPFTIPIDPPRMDSTLIGASVIQPLMRNLFYSPITILEKTQFLAYQASLYQNVQNIAAAVAATLTAYWQVVGNKLILDALIEQEKMLQRFVDYAKKLVEEDQKGSASLYQPQANLATTVQSRLNAEQILRTSYYALLLAMGEVGPCEDEDIYLNIKVEGFPEHENLMKFDRCCYDKTRELIPIQRMDLVASYLFEDIAELNLQSAVNSALPQLNLNASYALKNTNTGTHRSALYESFPDKYKPEKDYTLGFTLNYPFCNDVAKGLIKQTKALLFQTQISTNQLENQIITNYKTAFTLNNSLVDQHEEAVIATRDNRAALDAEFTKLTVGLSSWFDVLGLATDTITAEITEYNIDTTYMQNLVQLHFLIGDLVRWDGHSCFMEIADFQKFCVDASDPVANQENKDSNNKGLEYERYPRNRG